MAKISKTQGTKQRTSKKTSRKTVKLSSKKTRTSSKVAKKAAKKISKQTAKKKIKKTTTQATNTARTASVKPKKLNRRKHRRFKIQNLWVTERNGDYEFVIPATDLSEGGIFLQGRLKTGATQSTLTMNLDGVGQLQVSAKQVHDVISENFYGTGYKFTDISKPQVSALRNYLRNLD